MYVNAGDTLTIQLQSPPPSLWAAASALAVNGPGVLGYASVAANSVASMLSGEGLPATVDASSLNSDGSIFVQVDVTANMDYASEQDVLSIATNAMYNVFGAMPASAVVSDINGVNLASGLVSSAPFSPAASAASNVSSAASAASTAGQAAAGVGKGVLQLTQTTLVLIAVVIIALLYFLTTEGGRKTAQALV